MEPIYTYMPMKQHCSPDADFLIDESFATCDMMFDADHKSSIMLRSKQQQSYDKLYSCLEGPTLEQKWSLSQLEPTPTYWNKISDEVQKLSATEFSSMDLTGNSPTEATSPFDQYADTLHDSINEQIDHQVKAIEDHQELYYSELRHEDAPENHFGHSQEMQELQFNQLARLTSSAEDLKQIEVTEQDETFAAPQMQRFFFSRGKILSFKMNVRSA